LVTCGLFKEVSSLLLNFS